MLRKRKVQRLLECGASVTVIARELTPALETLTTEGRIHRIDNDYDASHIRDAFLVVGATDRDDINAQISSDAQKRNILVNIVDDPEKCNFILPSLLRQGDLSIAISTGGKSPALARKLREDMEELYGPEYKTLLDILGKLRGKIIRRGRPCDQNKDMFESVVHSDILRYIREKNWPQVHDIVREMTGEDIGEEEP